MTASRRRSRWSRDGLAYLVDNPYLLPMKLARKATKREKNITRFDYGKTHGFWVRFQRTDDRGAKRVVSKMFSDAVHGGKAKAREAAIAWRDETAATLRAAPRGGAAGRARVDGGYVKRVELTRRGGLYPAYLAWIRMPDGRAASTTFSIEKWGPAEAKKRCQGYLARKRREAQAFKPPRR